MKACRRFHIEDVEPGDVLTLTAGTYHRGDWEGPKQFDITVRRTYKTNTFGWVIESREKIGGHPPDSSPATDTFYLEDDWRIEVAEQ